MRSNGDFLVMEEESLSFENEEDGLRFIKVLNNHCKDAKGRRKNT